MDTVFLTGANAEPAQSIARRLVATGSRVYGLAPHYLPCGFTHEDFIPLTLDLTDPHATAAATTPLLERDPTINAIILAAHHPHPEPYEATHPEDIITALAATLTTPLLLIRAILPTLIRHRGHIIALTHSLPPSHTGAALAATTQAALHTFTHTLFEELRDTGVKIAHLHLQHNTTPPDPAANRTPAPQSEINPEIVAETIETLLRLRENNALTALTLRPQATREEPRIPISAEPRLRTLSRITLPPPRNFPPPQENIPTPPRKRPPYAPQQTTPPDDDDTLDPELHYLLKPNAQPNPIQPQKTYTPQKTKHSNPTPPTKKHTQNTPPKHQQPTPQKHTPNPTRRPHRTHRPNTQLPPKNNNAPKHDKPSISD